VGIFIENGKFNKSQIPKFWFHAQGKTIAKFMSHVSSFLLRRRDNNDVSLRQLALYPYLLLPLEARLRAGHGS
jgi:hypothetical protein